MKPFLFGSKGEKSIKLTHSAEKSDYRKRSKHCIIMVQTEKETIIMKSLQTIQKTFKVFEILAKVGMILSFV